MTLYMTWYVFDNGKAKPLQLVENHGLSEVAIPECIQQPKQIYTFFFFYKQSIFDPCPKNCLSFSKK